LGSHRRLELDKSFAAETIHVGARASSPHFSITACFDDKSGQGWPRSDMTRIHNEPNFTRRRILE
jgi:hypothetical protein